MRRKAESRHRLGQRWSTDQVPSREDGETRQTTDQRRSAYTSLLVQAASFPPQPGKIPGPAGITIPNRNYMVLVPPDTRYETFYTVHLRDLQLFSWTGLVQMMAVLPSIEAQMPARGICPWSTERSSAASSRVGKWVLYAHHRAKCPGRRGSFPSGLIRPMLWLSVLCSQSGTFSPDCQGLPRSLLITGQKTIKGVNLGADG